MTACTERHTTAVDTDARRGPEATTERREGREGMARVIP